MFTLSVGNYREMFSNRVKALLAAIGWVGYAKDNGLPLTLMTSPEGETLLRYKP